MIHERRQKIDKCVNIERKTHMEHQLRVFSTLRCTDHTFLPFIENATQVKIRKIFSAKRDEKKIRDEFLLN